MNLGNGSSGSFVTRSTAPQLHRLGNAGGLAAGFLAHPFLASRRRFQLLRRLTIWVRWKSTDGADVEGILMKPADYDRSRKYRSWW
jgi:hypothetical protein